jgi:hypothetical protein
MSRALAWPLIGNSRNTSFTSILPKARETFLVKYLVFGDRQVWLSVLALRGYGLWGKSLSFPDTVTNKMQIIMPVLQGSCEARVRYQT